MTINSVAVLGAGVMGAQIAAHFANAGVPSLLLDVTAEAAEQGLKRARGLKPDPFFTPDTHKLISTASFDAGLPRLEDADWILEAVVEKLDVKRELLARVDAARRPGSIVSSNTSGIPIAAHCRRPQRRLPSSLARHALLQPAPISAPARSDPDRRDRPRGASRRSSCLPIDRLGKGVVVAKDSPGLHRQSPGAVRRGANSGGPRARRLHDRGDRRDHRPAIGRPKSATFRTLDLAGLDIVGHVIRDLHQRLPDAGARHVRGAARSSSRCWPRDWSARKPVRASTSA